MAAGDGGAGGAHAGAAGPGGTGPRTGRPPTATARCPPGAAAGTQRRGLTPLCPVQVCGGDSGTPRAGVAVTSGLSPPSARVAVIPALSPSTGVAVILSLAPCTGVVVQWPRLSPPIHVWQ